MSAGYKTLKGTICRQPFHVYSVISLVQNTNGLIILFWQYQEEEKSHISLP